ncbi:hypothetical protein BCR43DRAFT_537978 [Syncephalastrum racemosum]|uniref:Uncharacterized protein n=1 Tax=Syncephalastrum racemosum TaxID=13706 RepID=A0A1X2H0M3_SYNRA|nr:hypothetical protein BCR43DRAFT_537978 [Syncephalastrum racemosum]
MALSTPRTDNTSRQPERQWDDSASEASVNSQNNHARAPLFEDLPVYQASVRSRSDSLSSGSEVGIGPVAAMRLPMPAIKPRKRQERMKSHALLRSIIFPTLTLLVSLALIGVLIYIYVAANGQPRASFHLAGMELPVVLALIMSLTLLFVTGGISFIAEHALSLSYLLRSAISEYKWTLFHQTPTSLGSLEAFDGASRGIGGILRTLPAFTFNHVLVAAIILHLGLIAMQPAAQAIVKFDAPTKCMLNFSNSLMAANISALDHTTYDLNSGDPRTIRGVNDEALLNLGVRNSFQDFPMHMNAVCQDGAINCTYYDLFIPHTVAECTPGSLNTTTIVNVHANNVSTLQDFWWNKFSTVSDFFSATLPAAFFAGSMFGRTTYDLGNFTANNTKFLYDNFTFDPDSVKAFGDQSFVFVNYADSLSFYGYGQKDIRVHECTLRSYVNMTDFAMVNNSDILHATWDQVPVTFNYSVMGNNSYWAMYYLDSSFDHFFDWATVNSYAFQLSLMKLLVTQGDGNLWGTGSSISSRMNDFKSVDEFFTTVFKAASMTWSLQLTDNPSFAFGRTCIQLPEVYKLDPAQFLVLSLILLVPTVWWAVLWIMSLYHMNGVSRGHSLVSLLVSGLTPSARDKIRGVTHEDQYYVMQRARHVLVKFGERITSDGSVGQVTFGLPEEVKQVAEHHKTPAE